MSENLTKINKLTKLFRTFSAIISAISFIGAALAIVGIIIIVVTGKMDLAVFPGMKFETSSEAIAALISEFFSLICSGVIFLLAENCCNIGLRNKTPFTKESAKAVLVFGICEIALSPIPPLAAAIVSGVMDYEPAKDITNAGGFWFGACLLLFSLILGYGAELEEKKKAKSDL